MAVVLDTFSRRVVGWPMAGHLRTELVLDALDMALEQRRPAEVIHHSEPGCRYNAIAFGLRNKGVMGPPVDRLRRRLLRHAGV
jgi:putative transposase